MTISVVIPAYNAAKYIQRALASVLNQTCDVSEIIVVDDGSNDDTKSKIFELKDVRIKYFYQNNSGPATARNTGIINARGEYVAFLDADDQWCPTHLERGIQQLAIMENPTWFMCSYEIVGKSQVIRRMRFNKFGEIPFFELFNANSYIQTSGLIIKRDILFQVGLFVDNWKFGEDLNLWFKIGLLYPQIGYSSMIGMQYNKTVGSLTFDKSNYNLCNSLKVINNSVNVFRMVQNPAAQPILRQWIFRLVLDATMQNKKFILAYILQKWKDILTVPIKICTVILLFAPETISHLMANVLNKIEKLKRKMRALVR